MDQPPFQCGSVVRRAAAVRQVVESYGKHCLTWLWSTFLAVVVLSGRATAQSGVCPDGPDPPEAVTAVISLLNQLQLYGVSIGLAAAAVAFTYAGILVIIGGPERIERAKRVVTYTVFGLVIVLIAGGLVEVIKEPIC